MRPPAQTTQSSHKPERGVQPPFSNLIFLKHACHLLRMTTTTSTSTSVSTRKQDGCYLKNGSAANVEYADIAAALQAGITAYEALSSAQKTSEKTTATIFLIPFTKTYTTTTTTTYSTDSETGLITVTNISRVVANPVVTTRTQIAILTAMGGAVSGKRLRDGIQGALQYESEYSDIDHDGTLDKFKITYKIGTTWSNNTISGTVTTSSKTLAVGKTVPTQIGRASCRERV